MKNQKIEKKVFRELFRIILFLMYYIGMIALGVVLVYGVCRLTMIFYALIVRLGWLANVAWAGVCCFALMFALFLIKPLFSFTKDEKENRVEVTEKDCPKLFAIVHELSCLVGVKKPKHVYLTTEVNACVFYNTSFWSIFFPVQKNLEIGVGLLDGLSVEEFKSILAHEFGHFSQKSMKIGSAVYVLNTVIYNLVEKRDYWDRMLDKWCNINNFFSLFGRVTELAVSWVKYLTYRMYLFVQRGNLDLSREMEFDADFISCQCVGTDAFVSAMNKTDFIGARDQYFRQLKNFFLEDHIFIDGSLLRKRIFNGLLPIEEYPKPVYDKLYDASEKYSMIETKLQMNNVWDSHPSSEERIKRALECHVKGNGKLENALTVVPDEILKIVFEREDQLEKENLCDEDVKTIDDETFVLEAQKIIDYNLTPLVLQPFFYRDLIPIDCDKVLESEAQVSYPFVKNNAEILSHYSTLYSDYTKMIEISNGEMEVTDVYYDGILYGKDDLPLQQVADEIKTMKDKVMEIEEHIFAYLYQQMQKNEDKQQLVFYYHAFFYATKTCRAKKMDFDKKISQFKNKLNERLSDEDDLKKLCNAYYTFVKEVQQVIREIQLEYLEEMFCADYMGKIEIFANTEVKIPTELSEDMIMTVLSIATDISTFWVDLRTRSVMSIKNMAKGYLK